MKRRLTLLLAMLLILTSQSSAYAQTAGQPTDLGPGMALGVNDQGMVVGVTPHEFAPASGWTWHRGERTELGTLGGDWTLPRAINNRGDVVGASATADGTRRAFLWRDGSMADLGTLGGAASEALAVNKRGEVVGWSEDGEGRRRAFHWYGGNMTDLGTLGGSSSTANGISASGQIVGTAQRADGRESAALWAGRHEVVIDLVQHVVPDPVQQESLSFLRAHDINERGQIVGDYADLTGRGFRLDRLSPQGALVLQTVGFWAQPVALNSSGVAVGCGADEGFGCHAAAWTKTGQAIALPGLEAAAAGGSGARDINNSGVAVGWAHAGPDLEIRAVLWRVPRG